MPTNEPHPSGDRRSTIRPRSRTRRWALSAVVVVALLGAACGDDDDTSDDAASTGDDAAAAGASSDDDAYCEAALATETVPPPDIDFENATPEEMTEATKAFVNDSMKPLVDDLLEHVPTELDDDAAVMVDALDEVGDTGDFTVFDQPEVGAAIERFHAYDLATCGWNTVDVVAADYSFDGIPDELAAGVTSFDMTNDGTDAHEVVLLKKNEGVTESFDELLEMPEDEADEKVTFVGVADPVPSGETTYLVADLEPGEYLALCFIPVGATNLDGPPPEGPPHFMSGMSEEFTVS